MTQQQLQLCACGRCRLTPKPGNQYIKGHNGRKFPEKAKSKMSIIAKAKIDHLAPNWKGGRSDSYRKALKQRQRNDSTRTTTY